MRVAIVILQGARRPNPQRKEKVMLRWALVFFIVALLAAVFGFFGIAGAAAGIAKFLFFAFLILAVVSIIANAVQGRTV